MIKRRLPTGKLPLQPAYPAIINPKSHPVTSNPRDLAILLTKYKTSQDRNPAKYNAIAEIAIEKNAFNNISSKDLMIFAQTFAKNQIKHQPFFDKVSDAFLSKKYMIEHEPRAAINILWSFSKLRIFAPG